ncbi:hypothetical protein Bpfe_022227 [Biomphalaria pfeifferi]|uniref:Uncharacterized protein n=1 Tax=Biomphalaria pfeifferi TaxID=112525 RepID=A0AAD8B7R8_BIOPF|nr:hypothetical protein Bpfe_022227 [Biomphalaria pfeifferi]
MPQPAPPKDAKASIYPQIRRYFAIASTMFTLALTFVGLSSNVWVKVTVSGTLTETEGIFRRCTTVCVFVPNPTKWRTLVWYLCFLFLILVLILLLLQGVGLLMDFFTASFFYGLGYASSAFIGLCILILYPTQVRPIGKEELIHVQLGWGFYLYFIGICSMVSLSVQCLEMSGTSSYPSMNIMLEF